MAGYGSGGEAKMQEKSKSASGIGWVDAGSRRRDAVSFGVEGEVIGARESAAAVGARERPISGVLPAVSSQLVRPSKLPSASWPLARVGLLAYTHAHRNVSP